MWYNAYYKGGIYMLKNEVWKTYPEFPWIEGNHFGELRTVDRYVSNGKGGKRFVKGRVLKQNCNRYGYLYVTLSVNGKTFQKYVHRIIASCFLPNPMELPEINHKDNNPLNNEVLNLEWCTHEYNVAYKEKFGTPSKDCVPKKPIIAINLETQQILYFLSQMEASRQLRVSTGSIWYVLKGQRNRASNYWFVNADSSTIEVIRRKFGRSMANKVKELMKDAKLQSV